MYLLNVSITNLRRGYCERLDRHCSTKEEAINSLETLCRARGIDPSKLVSRARSVQKGTAQGIKLYYTKMPGYRYYIWIQIWKQASFLDLIKED